MKKKSKKIDWVNHGINFIVVLFSILLAFTLDGYRSDLKDREVEKRNMISMLSDLKEDITVLDSFSQHYKKNVQALTRLKRDSITEYNHREIDEKQVTEDFVYTTFSIRAFYPKNITYESMRVSGRLDIVTNAKLKKAIIELNYKTYGNQLLERETQHAGHVKNAYKEESKLVEYDFINKKTFFKQPDYNRLLGNQITYFKVKQREYTSMKEECIELSKTIKEEFNVK